MGISRVSGGTNAAPPKILWSKFKKGEKLTKDLKIKLSPYYKGNIELTVPKGSVFHEGTKFTEGGKLFTPWMVFTLPEGKSMTILPGLEITNLESVHGTGKQFEKGVWIEGSFFEGRLAKDFTFNGKTFKKGSPIDIDIKDGKLVRITETEPYDTGYGDKFYQPKNR